MYSLGLCERCHRCKLLVVLVVGEYVHLKDESLGGWLQKMKNRRED